MADFLETSMAQFVEKLKEQLPKQIVIAQEIDVDTLQQALKESVQKAFEEKFRPIDAEIKQQIAEMKRSTEENVNRLQQSQEAEQKQVVDAFNGLKMQQEQQTQLINEIEGVVQMKQQELANSQRTLMGQIEMLRGNVETLYQNAVQLQANIEARKQKAVLGEIDSTGRFAKFQVTNKKSFYLENVELHFMFQEQLIGFGRVQPAQAVEGPQGIPCGQSEMRAELPDLQPNISFQVCLSMNGTPISNYVQFDT